MKTAVVPTSTPINRVISLGSRLDGKMRCGSSSVANTAAVNPAYMAMPPSRGITPR